MNLVAGGSTTEHGRFGALDGLRGVAAVAVVLHHTGNEHLGPLNPFFGYIAVDLFFALSGFVIAYSYDRRFANGLSVSEFMRKRFIRLYPLYAIGFGLSLLTIPIVLNATPNIYSTDTTSYWLIASTAITNMLLLPGPSAYLFPLNHPAWSLFFEVWIANLSYAILWRWLGWRSLLATTAVSALAIIFLTFRLHTINQGWEWQGFWLGLARVCFSFYAGVLISRAQPFLPKVRVPSWALLLFVVIILCMPLHNHGGRSFAIAAVLIGFPVIVHLGTSSTERRPWLGKQLGDLSYGIYAIHWPIVVLTAYAYLPRAKELGAPGSSASLQIALTLIIAAFSLALHRYFDEPVRAWISARLRRITL